MEIKGKIKIFPEVRETKTEEGEVSSRIICKGTISSKTESGYVNKSVMIRFAGKQFPAEKVNKLNPDECYTLEVESGFLAIESYMSHGNEKRDLVFVVMEGRLLDHRPVVRKEAKVDNDLPF